MADLNNVYTRVCQHLAAATEAYAEHRTEMIEESRDEFDRLWDVVRRVEQGFLSGEPKLPALLALQKDVEEYAYGLNSSFTMTRVACTMLAHLTAAITDMECEVISLLQKISILCTDMEMYDEIVEISSSSFKLAEFVASRNKRFGIPAYILQHFLSISGILEALMREDEYKDAAMEAKGCLNALERLYGYK